ncbi:DUF397 domain-containing protein [Streptomyces sp. NPDC048506]|uniref:DUF397 domain-containing protein n=1 Tax=Streptomyces sp. NPDC048506 TaxID=3155028 RepID=UPI00342FEC17
MRQHDRNDRSSASWRKSSYSNAEGAECVEVADSVRGLIPVRDSKATPHGPALLIPVAAWDAFVRAVKNDALR